MRGIATVILLILSNTLMTLGWYGHLKFSVMKWRQQFGLFSMILISWGLVQD